MNTLSTLIKNSVLRFSAAMLLLSCLYTGTATAQTDITATDQAAKYGCNDQQGIETYMKNIIEDAQRREITCEESKGYFSACITVYCSICPDTDTRENCEQIASDYYQNSPGFCLQPAALPVNSVKNI